MALTRKCAALALILATVVAMAGCMSPSAPGCSGRLVLRAQPQCPPPAAPPGTPSGPSVDPAEVAAQVRATPAVVSAIVFDRSTGRQLLTEQPDRHFQAASLVKLVIALDVLAGGPVDDHTADRLRLMLSASDDQQASAFWEAGGGGAIVQRTAAAVGLSAVPPPSTGQWGHTRISAQDVLAVYRHITERLSTADRELILSALRGAPRIAADGFDQYFGIPDGLPGQPLAIKQGWSTGDGVLAVHSTGLVGAAERFVVVLMTEHPVAVGWPAAARLATHLAGLLAPLVDQGG